MKPDAIVVLPAGVVPSETGGLRSTTYAESDGWGMLGGYDRIRATALLASTYPEAVVVTIANLESFQDVYRDELCALGVSLDRVVPRLEEAPTTLAGVRSALSLANEQGWQRILLVSSGFHTPRIKEFVSREDHSLEVECVASEPIIIAADPSFADYFARVQQTAEYKKRLAFEEQGVDDIKNGVYASASFNKSER